MGKRRWTLKGGAGANGKGTGAGGGGGDFQRLKDIRDGGWFKLLTDKERQDFEICEAGGVRHVRMREKDSEDVANVHFADPNTMHQKDCVSGGCEYQSQPNCTTADSDHRMEMTNSEPGLQCTEEDRRQTLTTDPVSYDSMEPMDHAYYGGSSHLHHITSYPRSDMHCRDDFPPVHLHFPHPWDGMIEPQTGMTLQWTDYETNDNYEITSFSGHNGQTWADSSHVGVLATQVSSSGQDSAVPYWLYDVPS
ncbi:hypothetical protein MBLNU459_g7633t1 [Dothideomycetes sp. NU459]